MGPRPDPCLPPDRAGDGFSRGQQPLDGLQRLPGRRRWLLQRQPKAPKEAEEPWRDEDKARKRMPRMPGRAVHQSARSTVLKTSTQLTGAPIVPPRRRKKQRRRRRGRRCREAQPFGRSHFQCHHKMEGKRSLRGSDFSAARRPCEDRVNSTLLYRYPRSTRPENNPIMVPAATSSPRPPRKNANLLHSNCRSHR